MIGAHGLQRDDHEHVHCAFCGANGVHVELEPQRWGKDPDAVLYGPHERKGSTAKCMQSRGQDVPDEYRRQAAP